MRPRDNQRYSYGIASPRAPWRRVAKPLAVLFTLQLSGIGCAARAPELATPTRPDELAPLLAVYEEQLDQQGITLEGAEDYVIGRSESPLPPAEAPADTWPADMEAAGDEVAGTEADGYEATVNEATEGAGADGPTAAVSPFQDTGGQMTFKVVDGVAEYVFGPGDVVQVITYLGPEPPTTTTHRVQADGNIQIARFGLGSVVAAGATPTELTRVLTGMFRQYVPAGLAEVRVEEYNAWSATLTGEIRNTPNGGAGNYPIRGRISLGEFINAYGGPTPNADLGDVRVVRQGNELRFDLASILAGAADDPPVRAGDIVQVASIAQGSSRMFIFGEVREPGVYTYSEGISVLDAIAQAGGWTQTAKRDAVYVSRPTSGEVIPVNLDVTLGAGQVASAPALEPGDFVVVPFSPDRSQKIRDWVGIASLILSALTILELIRRD